MNKSISFDEMFKIWLDNEVLQVEGRNLLPVAHQKGFTSITQWRLDTALRFGLDKLSWHLEIIDKPNEILPNVIIGPYRGWSIQKEIEFFDNQLGTTFTQALEIKEFFEFCKTHDRIIPLSQKFPLPTSIILVRRSNGDFIHIEGGHRICAVAYSIKIGKPLVFDNKPPVTAAIADISEKQYEFLKQFTK